MIEKSMLDVYKSMLAEAIKRREEYPVDHSHYGKITEQIQRLKASIEYMGSKSKDNSKGKNHAGN
jgi:hypothetical protein